MQVEQLPDVSLLNPKVKLFSEMKIAGMNLNQKQMKIIDYVIERNINGVMPLIKELERSFYNNDLGTINFELNNYKGIIGSYSILRIARTYGTEKRSRGIKFAMPQSLRFMENYITEYIGGGRTGKAVAWKDKNSDAIRYPHCLIAWVKKDGKPVFNKIFSYSNGK